MGTTGRGSFQDYRDEDSDNKNQCDDVFKTNLEEVENSDYFNNNDSLPDIGERLHISVDKRIKAVAENGETVGYLPTKYNYLKFCMDEGYLYLAEVTQSLAVPLPKIKVEVSPIDSE